MQSLNPQSQCFLDFDKMQGLATAYNANIEDLKHELHSAKRLLERRCGEGKKLPQSLLQFVISLEPFEEAFY